MAPNELKNGDQCFSGIFVPDYLDLNFFESVFHFTALLVISMSQAQPCFKKYASLSRNVSRDEHELGLKF